MDYIPLRHNAFGEFRSRVTVWNLSAVDLRQAFIEQQQTVERVISRDGTPIAYHRRGSGPPLILVHGGGGANALAWTGLLPRLLPHFTVCAVDRRGYRESGDAPAYAIEREFEDIAVLVDAMPQPADLLGHSFGAIVCLEAALRARNVRRLVLYEPPIPPPGARAYPDGIIERLDALQRAGDRDGILITLYREVVQLSEFEIDRLRSSPAWAERLASTATLPRETRAHNEYVFDARPFADLHTPTLILMGGDSIPFLRGAAGRVDAALPNSRIAIMPGQGHAAMHTAPDLFADEVLAFLTEPG